MIRPGVLQRCCGKGRFSRVFAKQAALPATFMALVHREVGMWVRVTVAAVVLGRRRGNYPDGEKEKDDKGNSYFLHGASA